MAIPRVTGPYAGTTAHPVAGPGRSPAGRTTPSGTDWSKVPVSHLIGPPPPARPAPPGGWSPWRGGIRATGATGRGWRGAMGVPGRPYPPRSAEEIVRSFINAGPGAEPQVPRGKMWSEQARDRWEQQQRENMRRAAEEHRRGERGETRAERKQREINKLWAEFMFFRELGSQAFYRNEWDLLHVDQRNADQAWRRYKQALGHEPEYWGEGVEGPIGY